MTDGSEPTRTPARLSLAASEIAAPAAEPRHTAGPTRLLPGHQALRAAFVAFGALALLNACLAFHDARVDEPRAPDALPTEFVTLDGVELHILDLGPRSGPAVVLIHGFGSSLETWRGLIPRLTPHHRVVALDLKGFGLSARPPGDYSPQAEAQLVVHLMDRLGIKTAALVAHSWGSSVALSAALLAPERVTRLALYGAWIYDEQLPPFFRWAQHDGLGEALFALYYKERPDERMARAFYDPDLIDERYLERVISELDRPGTVAAALAAVRAQGLDRLALRYPEVRQPTLLLWGREDRVSPPHFGERLATDLPDATLHIFPRCGHFPHVEAFASSTRLLLDFLGEGP